MALVGCFENVLNFQSLVDLQAKETILGYVRVDSGNHLHVSHYKKDRYNINDNYCF